MTDVIKAFQLCEEWLAEQVAEYRKHLATLNISFTTDDSVTGRRCYRTLGSEFNITIYIDVTFVRLGLRSLELQTIRDWATLQTLMED